MQSQSRSCTREKGKPDGYQWVFGADASKTDVDGDGRFWLNSGKSGLMELFRAEDDATYRLQADILHESASRSDSYVGLYAGEQLFPHTKGIGRSFANLTFNDLRAPDLDKGNQGDFFVRYTTYQDVILGGEQNLRYDTTAFLRQPETWRTLRLEMSPTHLTAAWLDQEKTVRLVHWDWDGFAKTNQLVLNQQDGLPYGPKDLPPSFRGGMGFYLFRSSIIVKNVSIEKL